MEFQEYHAQVKAKFLNQRQREINGLDTLVTYEEVFEWKWIATKLKIFSFLAYAEKIDKNTITCYSQHCLSYALKNKKGLPRGFQNGVVSYAILASNNIDPAAIAFASKRPSKHWSAFEMPILVDLAQRKLYYYQDNILWGCIYDSFLNEYILRNFTL